MSTNKIPGLSLAAAVFVAGFGAPVVASAAPQPVPVTISDSDVPRSPASQRNAARKAQEYLGFSAFSRQGLIEQLEYDGFSVNDATYAVDSLDMDWNQQAVEKAKEYLEFSSFSEDGLADQLEFDGFTGAQALYGVSIAYR